MSNLKVLFFLILFHTIYGYVNNKPLFLTIEEFSCRPCARPAFGTKLQLCASAPPCLHTGIPVFQWPTFEASGTDYCSLPVDFESDDLSLDPESKLTFTRTRVCFYDSEWVPKFRFRCANQTSWQVGTLRIVHEVRDCREPSNNLEILQTQSSKALAPPKKPPSFAHSFPERSLRGRSAGECRRGITRHKNHGVARKWTPSLLLHVGTGRY